MSMQHARQRLLTIRAELEARLVRTQKHLHRDEPVSPHFHEQAVETRNDAVVDVLDEATQAELRQIDNALLRLDRGEYDRCSNCSKQICAQRLDALPWTDLCINCA
jgi:DnaK suppressor protein